MVMTETKYDLDDFYIGPEHRDTQFVENVFVSLAQLGVSMYNLTGEDIESLKRDYPALHEALCIVHYTMARQDEVEEVEIVEIPFADLPPALVDFLEKVRAARVQDMESEEGIKEDDVTPDEPE